MRGDQSPEETQEEDTRLDKVTRYIVRRIVDSPTLIGCVIMAESNDIITLLQNNQSVIDLFSFSSHYIQLMF